jgi:hypothetical protein
MTRHHAERVTKIASHRRESAAVNRHHPLMQAAMPARRHRQAGDSNRGDQNDY